jgi:TolB protein
LWGGAGGADARRLLETDLVLTSLFSVAASPDDADLAVSGTASDTGVTASVTTRSTKAELLSGTFSGTWRDGVHKLADAMLEKGAGVKGFLTNKAAFVSKQTGKKEIYVMDIDGGNVHALTNDKVESLGPKLSTDGTKLAYVSYKSGYPDVWVMDLVNRSRKKVAFYAGSNLSPSFSPDGSQIALVISKDANPEIYTIASGGGSPQRLTNSRSTEATPVWSPDGSKIAFVSDERGSTQIFTMPSTGGAPAVLKTNSTYTSEPAFSPDGTKIAYSIRVAGQSQIGVSDLASGAQDLLTKTGGCETPAWTSNSRHIVYAKNGALNVLDSKTKQSVEIKNNLTQCSEPSVSR